MPIDQGQVSDITNSDLIGRSRKELAKQHIFSHNSPWVGYGGAWALRTGVQRTEATAVQLDARRVALGMARKGGGDEGLPAEHWARCPAQLLIIAGGADV